MVLLRLVQKYKGVKFSNFIAISLLLCLYNSPIYAQYNIERRIDSIFTNNQNDFKKTIHLLNDISTNNTKGLAAKYHRIGTCYFRLSDNKTQNKLQDSAKKYLENARKILHTEKSYERLAKVYYNLGMLFESKNSPKDAIINFKESIKYFENDEDKSDSHNYIAEIHLQNVQYTNALIEAKKAIKIAPDNSDAMANALIENGNIFVEIEQLDSARLYFEKATNFPSVQRKAYRNLGTIEHIRGKYKNAISSYLKGKDDDDIQNIYTNLSNAYLQIKKYKQAKEYLDKAKATANTNELLANTYDNYTAYYLAINDLPSAIKYNKLALKHVPKTDPTLHSEILINQLEVLKRGKSLKEAINVAYHIDRLADRVRNNQNDDGSKIIWRKKIITFYDLALSICHDLNDSKNAYYFMEKSRAVVLQEALRKASMGKQNANNQVLSLAELQKRLADKQTYLSYFVGDNAIFVFQADRQNYAFKKLALSRPQYNALSTDFLNWCSGKTRSNASAKKLYNYLFAPLGIPAGQRVIISTNAALLPFGALQNDAGKYLVHDYAFSYAFSASLLFDPPKITKPQAHYQFLAVQPHSFKQDLAMLPDVSNSIGTIRKLGYWGRKDFETDAIKNNFLYEAARAKIIYFFTHAQANEENTKIHLWNESLTLEDVYALQGKIASDLVCFAACKTALGKEERGEGVMSFARAFAYAGVPALLSTLWSVDSGYTGSIYSYFFENMSNKQTKDVALQAAQIRFLNDSDNDTSPKNWAGLIILGDTTNIDNRKPASNTLLTIALCLVFGGFLWWWWKN